MSDHSKFPKFDKLLAFLTKEKARLVAKHGIRVDESQVDAKLGGKSKSHVGSLYSLVGLKQHSQTLVMVYLTKHQS